MSALLSGLRSNVCHRKGLDDIRLTGESFPQRFLERRKRKLERRDPADRCQTCELVHPSLLR